MSEDWEKVRRRIFDLVCSRAGGEAGREEFFRMTKGGDHVHLVQDESLLQEVRSIFVQEFELGNDAMEAAPRQPFYFKLLEKVLESWKRREIANGTSWIGANRTALGCARGATEDTCGLRATGEVVVG